MRKRTRPDPIADEEQLAGTTETPEPTDALAVPSPEPETVLATEAEAPPEPETVLATEAEAPPETQAALREEAGVAEPVRRAPVRLPDAWAAGPKRRGLFGRRSRSDRHDHLRSAPATVTPPADEDAFDFGPEVHSGKRLGLDLEPASEAHPDTGPDVDLEVPPRAEAADSPPSPASRSADFDDGIELDPGFDFEPPAAMLDEAPEPPSASTDATSAESWDIWSTPPVSDEHAGDPADRRSA